MEYIFEEWDQDGSGQIDIQELRSVLVNISKDIGVKCPTEDETTQILAELDLDDGGTVSIMEFKVLIKTILEVMARVGEISLWERWWFWRDVEYFFKCVRFVN